MLNEIRRWLKEGATIKATDPSGKVLEWQKDGAIYGGLTITAPNNGIEVKIEPGIFISRSRRISHG